MRAALLLAAALALGAASCSGDGGGDPADGSAGETTTTGAPATEGERGEGTILVRMEEIEGILFEGFEVGLRFTDAATGEELDRVVWSEYIATLGPEAGPEAAYDAVYESVVPAGTVRVGADVNIGIGPGPAPPDLDADPLPCELDVGVPADGVVHVTVAFDDTADECLQTTTGLVD